MSRPNKRHSEEYSTHTSGNTLGYVYIAYIHFGNYLKDFIISN